MIFSNQDEVVLKSYSYCLKLNKPKGLKVAKEELRSIGSMVDRLDGQ